MFHGTLVNDLIPNPSVYLRVVRFLAILVIGIVLIRAVLIPVTRRVLRKREVGTEAINSVLSLTSVIGYFLSFTIALQAANFGSIVTILGAMAAAFVLAMGFGMRDQISNIVGGLLIYVSNPFIVGDYIKSQTAEGVVESINLVSTTLAGSSSQKIVVPNAQLTTEELKNYTKDSRTKASIRVTLPLEQLEEGLIDSKTSLTNVQRCLMTPHLTSSIAKRTVRCMLSCISGWKPREPRRKSRAIFSKISLERWWKPNLPT
ncbi:mechanosensitive ion channel family protein [Halanaeroarchaeum sulfurireducens]|uniref:Mechanosensitive ion channel MscS n=1 Tax=Halanaeroarchaeum sulfurireducens TaxID=1604004 RepID=A0A0F7PGE0_9EURY|nr:mechanosensitive ion channel domain-containing protein [Halanaeroarchaeum sulfurireducens]AKH98368.1 mechanosensitive ion channel MscS [Halanaeroarchaeum sulfurireducens]ALG82762.1 mechanosensitive ion channel MscS [Halanaeroarchaeum sulfurireducens]